MGLAVKVFTLGVAVSLIGNLQMVRAQAVGLAEWVKFGQVLSNVVYPGLREKLSKEKSWDAFGHACTWRMEGGFHRWQWKWNGKIRCAGLGEWSKGGCKSKGCAFKEPLKQYFTALASAKVAPADQLIQKIRECGCGFNEINELIASVTQG